MTATFVALLFAHVLADFTLQNKAMVGGKARLGTLLLHGSIVLMTAILATGALSPWLVLLAVTHILIDWVKVQLFGAQREGLAAFILDQTAHILIIFAVALTTGTLWQAGLWHALLPEPWSTALLHVMLWLTGLILITSAGSFAVSKVMHVVGTDIPQENAGMDRAGHVIGILERLLIYLLILHGEIGAIGFLVAAKSILRIGDERKNTEYVIIGTLASFSWAVLVTLAVKGLLGTLTPLTPGQLFP